jgi:N-formylmaleamate deformylase
MSGWQSGDVTANGIGMHYYRTGGDKPQLVVSHGGSDSGLCWTRVTRELEADYDVIMPDARCHGLSDSPEGQSGFESQAHDLADFIRVLGLDKPAIGGHSMGAMSSLYCAAHYPDLMRCLILEDGGIGFNFGPDAPGSAERNEAIAREMDRQRSLSREELIELGRKQSPKWDEVELGPWADSKLQNRLNPRMLFKERLSITWQEALAKVACPVLVLTADNSLGSMIAPEHVAEAKAIKPSLKVVNLSGAGHNIRREAFDGFVKAVREFLAEV